MRDGLSPWESQGEGLLQKTAYPVDSDRGSMRGLFTEVRAGVGVGQGEGCPAGETGARQ